MSIAPRVILIKPPSADNNERYCSIYRPNESMVNFPIKLRILFSQHFLSFWQCCCQTVNFSTEKSIFRIDTIDFLRKRERGKLWKFATHATRWINVCDCVVVTVAHQLIKVVIFCIVVDRRLLWACVEQQCWSRPPVIVGNMAPRLMISLSSR